MKPSKHGENLQEFQVLVSSKDQTSHNSHSSGHLAPDNYTETEMIFIILNECPFVTRLHHSESLFSKDENKCQ